MGFDPFFDDWLVDLRQSFAIDNRLAHAKITGVTSDVPVPWIYLPPLIAEPGRYWPAWLCWVFGHHPGENLSPAESKHRCLCGAVVVTREQLYHRHGIALEWWWPRLIRRVWRVLP